MRPRQERHRPDTRSRILSAARDAFGAYGYDATTTRAIAGAADVSEPTIYRQFGSKEALFDAAVLTPFTDFLGRHVTEWSCYDPGTLPAIEVTRRFYNELVGLFLEERSILIALLAASHLGEAPPTVKQRLQEAMRQIIAVVEERVYGEARNRGYTGFDVAAVVRLMAGMAFATVTLPWLFDADGVPRARLVDEMARMTLYGTEFRDQPLSDDAKVTRRQRVPAKLAHQKVDAATWELIAPLVNTRRVSRKGPGRIDDRTVLEGILEILTTGQTWADLPASTFGVSGITCWRRLNDWRKAGIWPMVVTNLRAAGIDLAEQ